MNITGRYGHTSVIDIAREEFTRQYNLRNYGKTKLLVAL
jgi:hypothetical protein